jgi:ribosome-associated protein
VKNTILEKICQAIADKKGMNAVVIDVRGISSLTDYFVIAEGNVARHVIAVARNVVDSLKNDGISPIHIEGLSEGSWVVLDYLDVVVHVFTTELRNRYAIEEIWKEGSIVSIDVDYEPSPVPSAKKLRDMMEHEKA